MKILNAKAAPAAIGPYSQAIAAHGLVFVSGQLPIDPETGQIASDNPAEQTKQSIKNITAILATLDLTLAHVVKTTILLADIKDYPAVNVAYAEMFQDHKPARAAYQVVALPKPGALVEIEAIATQD